MACDHTGGLPVLVGPAGRSRRRAKASKQKALGGGGALRPRKTKIRPGAAKRRGYMAGRPAPPGGGAYPTIRMLPVGGMDQAIPRKRGESL